MEIENPTQMKPYYGTGDLPSTPNEDETEIGGFTKVSGGIRSYQVLVLIIILTLLGLIVVVIVFGIINLQSNDQIRSNTANVYCGETSETSCAGSCDNQEFGQDCYPLSFLPQIENTTTVTCLTGKCIYGAQIEELLEFDCGNEIFLDICRHLIVPGSKYSSGCLNVAAAGCGTSQPSCHYSFECAGLVL